MIRYFIVKVNPSFATEKNGVKFITLNRCTDIRRAENYYDWYSKEHPDEHIILRKCDFDFEGTVFMEDIKEYGGSTND